MNEVTINTNEIESIWEKDNLCFVKVKSGKVWLCPNLFNETKTKDYIKQGYGLITIPLSQKGKCDRDA